MGDEATSGQAFQWALTNGDIDQVKTCINENKTLAGEMLPNGRYPLSVAADYGQKEVIEFLITKGADVNANDRYGISPLLSAIYEGHTECVKILLQKGANKTVTAPDGSSLIDCAEKEEIKALLK
ncbi:hypothetical protein NP493_180g01024 [Ridgeia piscesae]|uniref:Myotrophin n=1 Tax=Ridgeia piscesae TaxID=27915 RepID=A0AAD9P2M2_RIDPI|nr:hypothetical protein NP493_180g01024 [Ridgeia piscesae]